MRKMLVTGLFTALLIAIAASQAAAADAADSQRVSVAFADLNIHSRAGAEVLYQRLKKASKSVCLLDSYRELGSLARVAEAESCYAAALQKAVARIDSALLREIHAG